MKNVLLAVALCFATVCAGQKKIQSRASNGNSVIVPVKKVNDSVPDLIPQKMNGKYGFINQAGKVVIPHVYSNVGFFTEDCSLLHSPNKKLRHFGTNKYASVRLNDIDYRIDKAGKRKYKYSKRDLGKCVAEYKKQLYRAYVFNGAYGLIEDAKFQDPADYNQFTIYPQYDYLYVLEGDDLKNPMIIAVYNNRFGVIDVHNNVIIPFEYSDIKRNFSWKLARLFEVTKDGVNYYFVDANNHGY